MNNIYTAIADGSVLRVYNALTGAHVSSRNIGDQILTVVVSSNVVTITTQRGSTQLMTTFDLPNLTQKNSRII